MPGSPPANGFLIFAEGTDEAKTLEQDIRESARENGSVAHTLRERNVIAHFSLARQDSRLLPDTSYGPQSVDAC